MNWEELKQRRKEERERIESSEWARIRSALADIPVAFCKLISFTIHNLAWIALAVAACATAIIIKVQPVQEMFIQALMGA